MSAAKHTQGDWRLELHDSGAFTIFLPPQFDMGWASTIASRGQWTHNAAESHANGRLLWAAPDLLAALKLLDEAFCADDYGTREGRNKGRAALVAARAAIAKAEGAAQ